MYGRPSPRSVIIGKLMIAIGKGGNVVQMLSAVMYIVHVAVNGMPPHTSMSPLLSIVMPYWTTILGIAVSEVVVFFAELYANNDGPAMQTSVEVTCQAVHMIWRNLLLN